jgi:hypothetical protein
MKCDHMASELFHHGCPDAESAPGGVHAIVIGVSQYAEERRDRARRFDDITGAAAGAARFASFLASGFNDPSGRPVKTVRLLLSPTNGETRYLPADGWSEASFDNVGQALDDWKADCDDHHRNVALLYAGGHGAVTTNGAQWVFLSKASRADDAYRYSVNLGSIQENMRFCQAQQNIYVFDCCALRDGSLPPVKRSGGLSIEECPPREQPGRESVITINAARVGTKTYSLNARDGTLLSWALLGDPRSSTPTALLRISGELVDGRFAITPRRLNDDLLPTILRNRRVSPIDGEEPLVRPKKSAEAITLPIPPPVFQLSMLCPPSPSHDRVGLVIKDADGAEVRRADRVTEDILLQLPAGKYKVEAVTHTGDRSDHNFYSVVVDRARKISVLDGGES